MEHFWFSWNAIKVTLNAPEATWTSLERSWNLLEGPWKPRHALKIPWNYWLVQKEIYKAYIDITTNCTLYVRVPVTVTHFKLRHSLPTDKSLSKRLFNPTSAEKCLFKLVSQASSLAGWKMSYCCQAFKKNHKQASNEAWREQQRSVAWETTVSNAEKNIPACDLLLPGRLCVLHVLSGKWLHIFFLPSESQLCTSNTAKQGWPYCWLNTRRSC